MSARRKTNRRWMAWIKPVAVGAGFTVLVIVLMLWLAGKFSPKVPPTVAAPATRPAIGADQRLVPARIVRVPVIESAVGTIRAVHESAAASKLVGRIVELDLKAGQQVRKGQVLARLDDTELRARVQQAEAAAEGAKAVLANAKTEEARLAQMLRDNAAAQAEYDRAAMNLRTAEADVRRTAEAIVEARSLLDYATIRSPMDGTVVDKKADVGDTIMPGQVIATLYDPRRLQLVASVRESLAHQLQIGQQIGVQIDVLDKACTGEVSEIVPEAQSASRSFQVKVTGPCPPGIYTGMFGRLQIPLDDEDVLVIPQAAVRKLGQVELVEVVVDGQVQRRAIRTGRSLGGNFEVLSGLAAGEQVVVPSRQGA